MYINPKLVRGGYIWARLKKIIEERWILITDIAEKSNSTQPSISNALNGKKAVSDDFFRRVAEAIPLTETEIQKIFMEADKEEFNYKYWIWIETLILEDLKWKPETTVEELEESLFQLSGVDNPTEEDKMTLRFALDMARKRAEEDKQKKNKK